MSAPVEVFRDDAGGCYLPAKGTGAPCWHVYAGGAWYEVFDFDGQRPVVSVYYGPTANREALGRPMAPWELPPRIAAKVAELEGGA